MEYLKNKIIIEDIKRMSDEIQELPNFFNKRILITGATGMIASYITALFIYLNEYKNANIDLYMLYRNKSKLVSKFGEAVLKNKKLHLVEQNINNSIMVDEDVDIIIHAASNASAYSMVHDPIEIFDANIIGTRNVLEFAKEHKVQHVHFLSTREIYGATDGKDSINETSYGTLIPEDVRNAYPISKKAAENLLALYSAKFNINYTISRIAHCYGPGMLIKNDGRIMSDLIGDVVAKRNITLKSKGESKRAFIYVTDVVEAVLKIISKGNIRNAYNVANETEELTIYSLATMLTKLFGERSASVKIDIQGNTGGYLKTKRVPLNVEKLNRLDWKPRIELRKGLMKTVDSFIE
ncbi:NAD-dependent epimerase/dehydratase family protein [Pediococcus pentosaceus]|uniref:NAD-dependent epimerase/dehydratase family protein n=1 Tax=Pediococcus pentosaceus TaxID=1255 RepID=UPI0025B0ED85|nr:NAD(P)-dependent oxidoreductase [Pediococcus pentosaceus]MDN3207600.1 NAD(P)-dependent oxidoreductase [Pediococcus pentosaceus]